MSTRSGFQAFSIDFSDWLDKLLLFAAFFIGVAGLLVIKGYLGQPLVSVLFAGAVLVTYVALAWTFSRHVVEPDVIGDNVYYLGFLFTLTSLAMTLYALAMAGVSEDLVRDVVAGFGIALSSTIVGVFLRVFMTQFRVDLVARDQANRAALSKAVREFRAELSDSTTQMKRFSIELAQKTRETNDRILKETESSADEILKGARASAETYASTLLAAVSEASGELRDRIRADLRESFATFKTEAEAATATLSEATRGFADSAATHGRAFTETQEATVAQSAQALSAMRKLHNALEEIAKAAPAHADKLAAALSMSAAQIDAAAKGMASEAATATSAANATLSEASRAIAASADAHGRTMTEAQKAAETQTAQSLAVMRKLQDAMNEIADAAPGRVDAVTAALAKSAEEIESATQTMGSKAAAATDAVQAQILSLDAVARDLVNSSRNAANSPKLDHEASVPSRNEVRLKFAPWRRSAS